LAIKRVLPTGRVEADDFTIERKDVPDLDA